VSRRAFNVKVRLFDPPPREHPRWHLWMQWACSISRTLVEAAAILHCDPDLLRDIPKAERPLMVMRSVGMVPAVWTEWGWLEGTFRADGVFDYECDQRPWRNREGKTT
jgi:hypothetical protein